METPVVTTSRVRISDLAALKATLLLAVLAIVIEMHFDHHRLDARYRAHCVSYMPDPLALSSPLLLITFKSHPATYLRVTAILSTTVSVTHQAIHHRTVKAKQCLVSINISMEKQTINTD